MIRFNLGFREPALTGLLAGKGAPRDRRARGTPAQQLPQTIKQPEHKSLY